MSHECKNASTSVDISPGAGLTVASAGVEVAVVCERCKAKAARHPVHSLDQLRSLPVDVLQRERWLRGRPNYRESDSVPFVGDPLVESIPELIDFLNYTDELLRSESGVARVEMILDAQDFVRAALDLMRSVRRV
jgi:hypothetical protein